MGDKEKILEQLEAARLKVQQYENKMQLLQNRQKHLEKKADKQRTHHLCNMGGAIQSISKEADMLTRVEFYSLMEQVFALPAVQELVTDAVQRAGGRERNPLCLLPCHSHCRSPVPQLHDGQAFSE